MNKHCSIPDDEFYIDWGWFYFYWDRFIDITVGPLNLWSWLEDGFLGFNIAIGRLVLESGRYLDPFPEFPWWKAWFVRIRINNWDRQ